jgi:hypothetical protein
MKHRCPYRTTNRPECPPAKRKGLVTINVGDRQFLGLTLFALAARHVRANGAEERIRPSPQADAPLRVASELVSDLSADPREGDTWTRERNCRI